MPTSQPISVAAPAKINLFLHITGRRDDGYHQLQTVFRAIDFFDTLSFLPISSLAKDQPLELVTEADLTATMEQNLVYKAGVALINFVKQHQAISENHFDSLPTVKITLTKRIPTGAGLGGGSSDAAATLVTLNRLWQLGLTAEQLQAIGMTLGADVPFFITAQDAIGEGIGEQLTPISLPPQRLLLLMPNDHISTAQLFAHPLLRRDCPPLAQSFLQHHAMSFTNQLQPPFCNVFEPVVRTLSPAVDAALSFLTQLAVHTHTTPRLTGSGGCVFLPLLDPLSPDLLKTWLADAPCPARVVKTLGG